MSLTAHGLEVLAGNLENNIDNNNNISVNVISKSNHDFAHVLYSELSKGKNSSNIFFSPLSIHVILALAYVGAGGQTAQEMATGLRLPDNVDVVKTGFQRLLQGMNLTNSVELEIANKIYLAKNSSVNDEFKKEATKNFFSEVQNVDFSLGAETVRIINKWMDEKTHHKIKKIIDKESVSAITALVLVNALYFKGHFNQAFKTHKTKSQPFHVTPKRTKMVEMMNVLHSFTLVKNRDLGANILELDYKEKLFSLVIILPFKVGQLPEVENKLRGTCLKNILESLKAEGRKPVDVFLPKFKLEQSINLNDHLKTLGMTKMFESDADFSAMSNSSLYVEEVLHKSFLEVNELGTEAAATTVFKDVFLSQRLDFEHTATTFVANHPFLFILRCKTPSIVLCMGRFANPQ